MGKANYVDEETIPEIKDLLKDFHAIWRLQGSPHPNSNAYLALNRAFFYTKGLERGIDISLGMQKASEEGSDNERPL